MSATAATLVALTYLWLGMVFAISFIEAPLKFRAPGVTIPIGLGIGRMVFRALNTVEVVLGLVILACLLREAQGALATTALAVALAALACQLLLVNPLLKRRSNAVLSGTKPADAPRSRTHYWYVGFELVKVVALIVGGIGVLAH
jgi:hypothetical protein